jgi:oxygen-independent coproporphyrinogen-3 oxidase
MKETMMMGLRLLKEGVSSLAFENRFGVRMEEVFRLEIEKFLDLGLLEWGQGKERKLVLTRRGYFLGNQVFSAFV